MEDRVPITIRLNEDDIPAGTKGYGLAVSELQRAGADLSAGKTSFDFDWSTCQLIAKWEP